MHENGLAGAKSRIFNESSGYFHSSEESRFERIEGEKQSEIPRFARHDKAV
jgi:hypothetical protein